MTLCFWTDRSGQTADPDQTAPGVRKFRNFTVVPLRLNPQRGTSVV